ncbi:molybdopterin molybdotransferase MoeA [Iodidimonas nitroreducens]|nr:gephyrin-like molybdotransferase Glp [Iodidimonas nitroreducens]
MNQVLIESSKCGCDRQGRPKDLLAWDQALTMIATQMTAHHPAADLSETIPCDQALGRVLAQPVITQSMVPSFDHAAMDGYALTTSTLIGNGPWALPIRARIAAGQAAPESLSGASAARIFTGAPVPKGADAVVMQEDVTRHGDQMLLTRRPARGLNIRHAGSDMMEGEIILEKGRRLRSGDIAACAAAGAGCVEVLKRPRVALLVSGDELRMAGGVRAAAQIWDVNTPMLLASLAATDAELVASVQGADHRIALAKQMDEMFAMADLVITTGGISVGEEDHVKPAFIGLGGEMLFSGVAIKPGKPVSFGRMGRSFWLGLPGNPFSAFVTWQIFGLALIRRLAGETVAVPARRHVVTKSAIRRKPGRCEFRPAMLAGFDPWGRDYVQFDDFTPSAGVKNLVSADGLIILPADIETLPAGSLVLFQPI